MGKTYKDLKDVDKSRRPTEKKPKGGAKNSTKDIIDNYVDDLASEWEDEQYLTDEDFIID